MRRLPNSKGFTLQELLITIMIISILSIVGFTTFRSVQLKGRDQRRKQDIQQISNALQLYFLTNKRYPCQPASPPPAVTSQSGGDWITDAFATCGFASGISLNATYILPQPIDPINDIHYHYSYGGDGTTATTYKLCARMESTSESPSNTIINGGGNCGGSFGEYYYYLTNP